MIKYNGCAELWGYSEFYSEILETIVRLRDDSESFAALFLLFSLMEQVFKSVRETDEFNLVDDINWLCDNNFITEKERVFLNDKDNGIRVLRNKMMHKNAYSFCIEIDGVAYSFSDINSWDTIFDVVCDDIVFIINKVISNKP